MKNLDYTGLDAKKVEKVVKELDDLKEFILEMSKLNFPLDSIKEGVDSFIRDTEYLQKTPNLNIDIEDILEDSTIEKIENIKNNDIVSTKNIEVNDMIIENNILKSIDNEKIEIIPNVIIDKNFKNLLIVKKHLRYFVIITV